MSAKVHGVAYSKIFLHAAKNPSSSIGGYLIGSQKGNEYEIADVVPVTHGNPAGPIFEISADMVDRLYSAAGTGKIVGYYYANESGIAPKVAYVDKVIEGIEASTGSKAVLFAVDNTAFGKKDALIFKATSDGKTIVCTTSEELSKVNNAIDSLLQSQKHLSLVDFEDHLDCAGAAVLEAGDAAPVRDFRNGSLNTAITALL